jgi:DNA polymerase-4
VDAVVVAIVDRVTRRMRTAGRVGRTVTLRLRFEDFTRVTRSHTLAEATAHTPTILATLRALVVEAQPLINERGLTLVGLSVANLDDRGAVQLALPFDRHATPALDEVLDDVHERFGSRAVGRAVLLGRDTGLTVPMLPD